MDYASPQPLRIAVVGAGLGGLASAVALRRQGHIIEIFESSATNTELGLGITLPPNASKVLQLLGYCRENIRPVEWKQGILIFQNSTRVTVDMNYYPSTFGSYWEVCSRGALHTELKRLALDEGQGQRGPICKLHLATRVISCDVEAGTIKLQDGRVLQYDVIIGADGIKSRIRQSIYNFRTDNMLEKALCAYRFTIEKHKVESIPELKWLMHEGPPGPRVMMTNDLRHIFMYAINCPERGEVLNMSVMCDEIRDQESAKWRVEVPREEMLARFDDFDGVYKSLLRLAGPTVTLWQLRSLHPIQTWARGKACVMGDAAHAMFQVLGQGAAMAFEDALLLGCLLPLGTSVEKVPDILKQYERIRKPRVHSVQILSTEEALTPDKRVGYLSSKALQSPIMGFDIYREMKRHQFHAKKRVLSNHPEVSKNERRMNLD